VRRGRSGGLTAGAVVAALQRFHLEFANLYRIAAVTRRVFVSAMNLAEKHALRGYDAVQLAVALRVQIRLKTPLLFVSADAALNTAASAEGLTVDNPNNYP